MYTQKVEDSQVFKKGIKKRSRWRDSNRVNKMEKKIDEIIFDEIGGRLLECILYESAYCSGIEPNVNSGSVQEKCDEKEVINTVRILINIKTEGIDEKYLSCGCGLIMEWLV